MSTTLKNAMYDLYHPPRSNAPRYIPRAFSGKSNMYESWYRGMLWGLILHGLLQYQFDKWEILRNHTETSRKPETKKLRYSIADIARGYIIGVDPALGYDGVGVFKMKDRAYNVK